MHAAEQWIWLPEAQYPENQTTRYSERVGRRKLLNFTVAEFTRSFAFSKPIVQVHMRFSGDTAFSLFCNDTHLANGPVLPGGDFLAGYHDEPLPKHYATEMTLSAEDMPTLTQGALAFRARVRMMPVQCFEFSRGHGGFFLSAHVCFTDGTSARLGTDSSWRARLLDAYRAPGVYDNSGTNPRESYAEEIPNIWNCEAAPIPPCTLTERIPEGGARFPVASGETVRKTLTLDMIYAGYPALKVKTAGELTIRIRYSELEEPGKEERYFFAKDGEYLGFELLSVGSVQVEAENAGPEDGEISISLVTSHYPAPDCARTVTSDKELDQVLATCIHTLKYCRQSIHLDSPKHCELLACTGDYYIEALMTAFSFGDMRLAAFDVRRTAELLRCRDGRLFHTTYSLIWVQMLMDVYKFTGERALLADCRDALILLLDRFHRYLGENGIIENPPDYMFIDWLVPDGISLHHPPKALGQSCLNLYYYGALKTAGDIFRILEEPAMVERCGQRMHALHRSIRDQLYDRERGLFFEGLNTPTLKELLGEWMPQNVEKRYYRRHANILATYFGFFDQSRCEALLRRVIADDSLGPVQPYFCHFLLEAVYRCGLREEFTLPLLAKWKEPVRQCPKGLAEGFYKPEDTYSFDHSHAWGGTPAYALPLALSGLQILEPGFRKIRLRPSLLGLSCASVEIPTPFGTIALRMEQGKEPVISLPKGITLA